MILFADLPPSAEVLRQDTHLTRFSQTIPSYNNIQLLQILTLFNIFFYSVHKVQYLPLSLPGHRLLIV